MLNKNQKLDSKVRFQRSGFRRELEQARNYKRRPKNLPERNLGVFFDRLGLTTTLRKLAALLVLMLVLYIIYIPNFLFIKNIQINGLVSQSSDQLRQSVEAYLHSKPALPQDNMIFLSKSGLADYLKLNTNIISVEHINKKFPGTLILQVKPRQNQYILETQNGSFVVSNDGLIMNESVEAPSSGASSTATSTLAGGFNTLVVIKINSQLNFSYHAQVLTNDLLNQLSAFLAAVPGMVKSAFDHFELTDFSTPDLTLVTKTGLKVYFDIKSNSKDSLERLQLLLANVADTDLPKLSYIDLRFSERAYICFKKAACDNTLSLPPKARGSASTTPAL